MGTEKQCENCGKEFKPTCHKNRQKFCSAQCRMEYHNKKRYGEPAHTCAECETILEQRSGKGRKQRFCSDRCRIVYTRKAQRERRQNREQPNKVCPNCGKDFQPAWGQTQRRFCCDSCRVEWWREYHKANLTETEPITQCIACGQEFSSEKRVGGKYCSRACYLQAMEQTHIEQNCEWCGEGMQTTTGTSRKYCSRSCYAAARHALPGACKARRRIPANDAEIWREQLKEAARKADDTSRHGKRVKLASGVTSMYTGLDGLIGIIQYQLRCNPYDGSVYVFRDLSGSMLKYLEWDGMGFCMGKRRAQSGSYPWPSSEPGTVVEISEREFAYLLSKSIVPTKAKKSHILEE